MNAALEDNIRHLEHQLYVCEQQIATQTERKARIERALAEKRRFTETTKNYDR